MNRKLIVLVVMLNILLGFGCASFHAKAERKLALGAASTADADMSGGYMLGPDDVIRVVVQQHPEWSGEYTISPDGKILIQGLGEVKIDGLVKDGIEVALMSFLGTYINEPKVSVYIVRYASQVVYVLGEVNRPGKYPTDGKVMTVRDAVLAAGLPTRFAATGRVYVITPSRVRHSQQVIDIDRILYRGEMSRNLYLKPGDIVFLPKSIWGKISEFLSMILSPLTSTGTAARTMATPLP